MPRLRVAVVYEGTVAPDHGGRRMLEQMSWLAEECHVSLAPVVEDKCTQLELSPEIERLGISVLDPVRLGRQSRLSRLLPSVPPQCKNMTHVERIAQASDWVVVGNTSLAGSMETVRSLRATGAVVSWDGDSLSRWHASYARWLWSRDPSRAVRRSISALSAARLERRIAREYDLLTVPGPADVAVVRRHADGRAPIFLVPNVVRMARPSVERRPTPISVDALFVGSAYGPNIDGLRWLLAKVWPHVKRQRPAARLTIAGRDLGRELVLATSRPPDGVEFVGRVAELESLYRSAKVVLVPLFYGSGVPNKALEALATDSAVVLTTHVAASLGRPPGLQAHAGAAEWIEAIVAALDDPRRGQVEAQTRETLLETHGARGFDRAMCEIINRVRILTKGRGAAGHSRVIPRKASRCSGTRR